MYLVFPFSINLYTILVPVRTSLEQSPSVQEIPVSTPMVGPIDEIAVIAAELVKATPPAIIAPFQIGSN